MPGFFQELKRRNVIRTGVAYLVAAWLVVEVVSVVAPAYNAPGWVLQLVIALVLLGLPVTLLFSWAYEMTPDGLKPEREVKPGESEPQKTARRLDAITIGLLILTLGFVLADRLWLGVHRDASPPENAAATAEALLHPNVPTPDLSGSSEISIAVLPFDNLSGDPEQAFLADGVHEALLTYLAKIGDMRVISRTSVSQFRDTDQSVPEIAEQLNVGWIIEGSVLGVGDQVRITAQLIDASSDEHRWAESYDRDLQDILTLMSAVARKIADEVQVALSPQEAALLATAPSVDPRAQEAYLRGRYHFNNYPDSGLQKAIAYFQQAIEIEPRFARAYASLAGAYFVSGLFGQAPRPEAAERVRTAAAKALELDENLGLAHSALGYLSLYVEWDWDSAEHYARRALELEPNDWASIHLYADWLGVTGRIHESVDWMRLGLLIDPLSPLAANSLIAHLFMDEQYDAVVEAYRDAEGIMRARSQSFLRRALWQAGKFDEAAELYLKSWNANGREDIAAAFEQGWASSGPEGAMAAAALAMESAPASEPPSPYVLAIYHIRGGNRQDALKWLRRALEQKDWGLIHIQIWPEFKPLHGDPEFEALLQTMGLPATAGVR